MGPAQKQRLGPSDGRPSLPTPGSADRRYWFGDVGGAQDDGGAKFDPHDWSVAEGAAGHEVEPGQEQSCGRCTAATCGARMHALLGLRESEFGSWCVERVVWRYGVVTVAVKTSSPIGWPVAGSIAASSRPSVQIGWAMPPYAAMPS